MMEDSAAACVAGNFAQGLEKAKETVSESTGIAVMATAPF